MEDQGKLWTSDSKWAKQHVEFLHRQLGEVGINQSIMDESFLDIGCGAATLLEAVGEYHPTARLAGVDIDPDAVKAARKKVPRARIEQANAQHTPFGDNSFTFVYSGSLFYYDGFWRPEKTLEVPRLAREIYRLLKPGGIYYMCEDAFTHYPRAFLKTGLHYPKIVDDPVIFQK